MATIQNTMYQQPSLLQQQTAQYKAGVQYTPYSPLSPVHSGATTPTNVSPTASFTSHNNVGSGMHTQLRRPKGPMYVPAVLRPTERPNKSSPPKGAESRHGSIDKSAAKDMVPQTIEALGSSLSEIERVASVEGESVLGEVTGPPSRNHWKLDDSSTTCSEPGCYRAFSLLCRRHHCRRCGDIFCYEHSSHEIKLDQDALFHPRGMHSRACDGCWSTYKQWESARTSRTNSASSQGSSTPPVNAAAAAQHAPAQGLPLPRGVSQAQQGHGFKVGSYVGSVPRDWNWSTF